MSGRSGLRRVARAVSIAIVLALVLLRTPVDADTAPTGTYVMKAVRADTPPPLVASIDAPQWKNASSVILDWDFTFHRPARERTTVYMLYDDKYIYLACVASQHDPVIATQHTNDVGDDLDDNFAVQFWPSGPTGIRYKFTATALGTRYEESSENDTYSPRWDAVGSIGRDGFTIVIRVPLDVMRGDGRTEWRLQFQRSRRKTGELFVWATDPAATDDDQGQYAGFLRGLSGIGSSTRTKPRLGMYELAALAPPSAGGSTSRIGADLAIPVTPTASVLATVHPDFSNVELDQQAIQPAEFARVLQEVRPFFAQGAGYYNRFDQVGNTNNIMLYTPLIPTPRIGTAIEGQQNGLSLAGFNSDGAASSDAAGALFWTSPDKRLLAGYQRVAVAQSGFYDEAQAGTFRFDNLHDFDVYTSYGADRGTNIAMPAYGNWEEVGARLYSPTSQLAAALKRIGDQYSPVDGIVDHPGIAGYAIETTRQFDFTSAAWLRSIVVYGALERYHDASSALPSSGLLNQGDQEMDISVSARNLFAFSATTGSHFLSTPTESGLFNENQVSLGYNLDGATPLSITYGGGRFGRGSLHTWTRTATFRLGQRGIIDAESDAASYLPDAGGSSVQQLERVGYTFQVTTDDAFTAGVRRVIGQPPNIGAGIQIEPGYNVSFALHHRRKASELYFVYGDPNAATTYPALTIKLIEYIGAEKGS